MTNVSHSIKEEWLKRIAYLLELMYSKGGSYDSWERTPGNSLSFTYYMGIEAGNPSGNANIKTISYYTGLDLKMVQTYTYDAGDKVISITSA